MYKDAICLILGGLAVGGYAYVTYLACKRFTSIWTAAGIMCITIFGIFLSRLWYSVKSVLKCSKIPQELYEEVKAQIPVNQKKAIIFEATSVKADVFIYLCYLLSSYLFVWWYVKYLFSVLLMRDAPKIFEIFPMRYVCCNSGSPTMELLIVAGIHKGIYKCQDTVMHSVGKITPEMF